MASKRIPATREEPTVYYYLLATLALANALVMQAFWPAILRKLGTTFSGWGDLGILILFFATYLGPTSMGIIIGLLLSRHVAW